MGEMLSSTTIPHHPHYLRHSRRPLANYIMGAGDVGEVLAGGPCDVIGSREMAATRHLSRFDPSHALLHGGRGRSMAPVLPALISPHVSHRAYRLWVGVWMIREGWFPGKEFL